MANASNYTENNLINALLRGIAFPEPSVVYVSLHTAEPGDTGLGEVSTSNWPAYVRRDAADGDPIATGWAAPVDGVTKNAQQITFPSNNGAGAVTVSHWALWDAATGGNMLAWGALQTPRTLLPGDILVMDVNAIEVAVL